MKKLAKWVWFSVIVLVSSAALAQPPEARHRRHFSQPELDQMLAPIALYPDALLSQILMAATYPRDVAEAASWSWANSGIRGDSAVRAVENEPWDPSVTSLVAFPHVLAMLDERRDWTARLGDAFIAQPEQVMETVQDLRARADAVGSLRSSDEVIVQRQGSDYVIEPPTPEVLYVPYYDPRYAYGTWWWPDYQPVYWRPWPGYAYRPGYRGLGWGYGITLGSGFFFGAIDWPRRHLRYSHHRPWYFHGRDYRGGNRWTHNRDHRRGDGDRWRDRGDRRGDRRQVAAPQGFFAPRAEAESARSAAPRNPAVRAAAPRYRPEGATPGRTQPRERAVREQPSNGLGRNAESPSYSAPRAPQVQQAPSPQQRVAPAGRQTAPAPQQSAAPLSRSSVERPAASQPSSIPSATSSPAPAQRSGGRGMDR